MGFAKKNLNFSKITTGGKFAVECVSKGMISLKSLFRPNHEVLWQKN